MGKKEFKKRIHKLREKADYFAFQSGRVTSFHHDSHKSLLLGKAWLGKMFSLFDEQTPYKNDGNRHSVEDIEDTDDTWEMAIDMTNDIFPDISGNQIEKIDKLREEIKILAKDTDTIAGSTPNLVNNFEFILYRDNAFSHFCEARFHLGFHLSDLKDQHNDN